MWSTPKYLPLGKDAQEIVFYDTGEMHSDTQASKPVMIFLHGLGLNSFFWKYTFDFLRSDFRCIAIDMPGHGLSKDFKGNFTMTFFSEVVREFIEKMKFQNVTLVGHSMSGQVSIISALRLPSVIQKLILVSPAGIETFSSGDGAKIIAGAEFFYKSPMDMQHLLNMYAPHFSVHTERARELAEEHLAQQNERFAHFGETIVSCIKGMINEPVNAFLPQLTQPVLVLYGQEERLIPNKILHATMTIQDVANEAKAKIRNAQVEVLPSCGHYLPIEVPAILSEKVRLYYLSAGT